jgi:hypothetical protein
MGVSAQHGADQQALAVMADTQPLDRMATARQAVSEVAVAMAPVPAAVQAVPLVAVALVGVALVAMPAVGVVALVSVVPAQFVVPPVVALAEAVAVPIAGEKARADVPV